MTRYVTTEKRYNCIHCKIWCTKREMIHCYVTTLKCPNCETPILFSSVKDMIEDTRTFRMHYDEIRDN
ncbi:hypothetical protein LCGC14_1434660 [marine sediment metagenome]|uniref:Uncharacterized protein n=1 Tax=marine sediment metagenome TaxID=412755 RepID=A0A0F9MPH4_9ZZZZ